jgi:hypothetical protein
LDLPNPIAPPGPPGKPPAPPARRLKKNNPANNATGNIKLPNKSPIPLASCAGNTVTSTCKNIKGQKRNRG